MKRFNHWKIQNLPRSGPRKAWPLSAFGCVPVTDDFASGPKVTRSWPLRLLKPERLWLTTETADDTISALCFIIDCQSPNLYRPTKSGARFAGQILSVERGVSRYI